MTTTRLETDGLGTRALPVDALYGIHSLRASENFPITGVTLGSFPELVRALAMVKLAAARANRDLGALDEARHGAIAHACGLIIDLQHHDSFVVDMIQGGAGTSTNMNANEVIANLGLVHLGHKPGDYARLHPNDHVNRAQSTNDVYPTAVRLAVIALAAPLLAEQTRLAAALRERAAHFAGIAKVGRTQLQDAVPMTLGAEFAAFASAVETDATWLQAALAALATVNLGGTAIGTGITTPAGYRERVLEHLSGISGIRIEGARNLIDASSNMGDLVSVSGALRRMAIGLSKICNDLRLLSSGPRAGFAEIALPPMQAGSSIMPGKVNPVIPEMVTQVCFRVIGHDMTVTMAAEAGQLQLNAMEPLIAFNLLESMRIMANAIASLTDRCVVGIRADPARCRLLLETGTALAAALVPGLGYDRAAQLARAAQESGTPLGDLVVREGHMDAGAFEALLFQSTGLMAGIETGDGKCL